MHSVAVVTATRAAGTAAVVGPAAVPASIDAGPGVAVTAAAAPVPACVCLHRKRTLDTLRQRLARRLKRARRHRHDVTGTGDDITDDVVTPTGEQLIVLRRQTGVFSVRGTTTLRVHINDQLVTSR